MPKPKPKQRAGQRGTTRSARPGLAAKFARVRLFLCDVDGVSTDGTVFMGDGVETKRFNIQDGLGLRILQKEGIKVGWISRRVSQATTQRAEDLKVDFLRQIEGRKVDAVEAILAETGLAWKDVCFVGDDVVDLGALTRAGVAVAVANGIHEVKAVADYVTKARGGYGAVREVVELILKAQHRWQRVIQEYSS